MLFLLLVLMAALIVPSQSQGGYPVSDAKMTVEYSKGDLIFEDEATKAICINQTFNTGMKTVQYIIAIKNTGETELTDVILEDVLPADVFYKSSESFDADGTYSLTPEEIVRNRDGTTKRIVWKLGELQTGEEKWIWLTVDRKDGGNDQKNAVMVTAYAFDESVKETFDDALEAVARLSVTGKIIGENEGENLTCRITVTNIGKTRLKDVVLNDTLPANMEYDGSVYSESVGGEILPTIINHFDGTTRSLSWFLGDFESMQEKSIDFTVNCDGSSFSNWNEWEAANKAEASGSTSILNKIPIKVTSQEDQEEDNVAPEVAVPEAVAEENEFAAPDGPIA